MYCNVILIHKDICISPVTLEDYCMYCSVTILNNRLMPEMSTYFRDQNLAART